MTHTEYNAALIDAFNRADWDRYRELVGGATYNEPATGRSLTGEDYVTGVQGWKTAFPDLTGEIVSELEAGDLAASEVIWTGTHTGPMMTPDGNMIPASGAVVSLPASFIGRYDGERLVSVTQYFDLLTILRPIGAA